jgi:L-lactate dehydrogenase
LVEPEISPLELWGQKKYDLSVRTPWTIVQDTYIRQVLKIAIVGVGHVGAATVFALVLKGLADEVVLIGIDQRRAEGEAIDLTHAALFASNHPNVHAGTYDDCKDAAIVIITAGNAQTYGEKGRALLEANLKIIKEVAPKIGKAAPRALLIVAAHPNEVLTYAAVKLSGLPDYRVIGYGTTLDTATFRYELAKHYGVDPQQVHAAIVGQHAISETPLWSTISIDGLPLRSYCERNGTDYKDDEVLACFWKAKEAAFVAIDHKGNPGFSIAAGIVTIVEAILGDENTLMTVSVAGSYLGVHDIALSVPTRLSRAGVKHMPIWSDNCAEEDGLRSVAEDIKKQIVSLGTLGPNQGNVETARSESAGARRN